MKRRWDRAADDPNSQIVYTAEEYTHLEELIGTADRAQDLLDLATTEIDRLCDCLAVGDDVADAATRLYRQVIRTDLVNNYSVGILSAAAVYTACRERREPRTLDDVTDATYVLVDSQINSTFKSRSRRFRSSRTYNGYELRSTAARIGVERAYRSIRDRFDRKYSPIEPEEFVERYCADLELDQAVEEVARVAIMQTDDEVIAGRSPSKIAVGAIYYACDTLGWDVTQHEIGYVTQCSTTTIGKTWKLIRESIEPSTEYCNLNVRTARLLQTSLVLYEPLVSLTLEYPHSQLVVHPT